MNSAEAALLTRELTPDHHTTAADGYTTARHGAAGDGRRDAINQHSSRTRRYGAGMRRMRGFGVRCEGMVHTGDRLAINQNIGGTGNHRGGREPVMVCAQDRKSTRLNASHVRIAYAV